MKLPRISVLLCFIAYLTVPAFTQDLPLFIEINKSWKFHKVGSNNWLDATVPGCVHTDLLSNKLITDPFYRDNETKLQWIDKNSWEYKTSFQLDKAFIEKQNIEIEFQGLDTYAEVFLNEEHILSTDNMFCDWKTDVKKYLREGSNSLRVLLHSPVVMGLLSREKFNLEAPNGYNLEFGNNEWPNVGPYMRKASYMFGWDWGPKLTTSGIWKPVILKGWNQVKINSLQLVQKDVSAVKANVLAICSVESGSGRDGKLKISYTVNGKAAEPKILAVKIHPGSNEFRELITIDKPALWWPNGLGAHPLYEFNCSLLLDDKEYDQVKTRTGLRTVKLVRKPESDGGTSFYFEVNGIPVFAKGANYIPSDIFPSRVRPEHYEGLIRAAADANMNMLRIWGGGIYENELFYDLCDQNGIMVWQDFAFAIYHMPDYPEFYESIKKELKDNIERLRNHPSIVLWCGNNETELLWDLLMKRFFGLPVPKDAGLLSSLLAFLPPPGKVDSTVTLRVMKAYDDVFYHFIPDAIEKYDFNSHEYWPSSPMGDWKKPITMQDPHSGDTHFYIAVLNLPFSAYLEVRSHFFSEHGFQAWPDKKAVYHFTSAADRKINSPVMNAHNKALGGNDMLNRYIYMYYKTARDFDSYIYLSQVLQAEGMKLALETHRRWMPFTMGTLYWQLNDVWPVASWSSLDFENNPKALQYFVKKAFSPTILVPSNYRDEFKVNLVSDNLKPVKGKLEMKIMDFSGKELWKQSSQVNMPGNTSQVFFQRKTSELVNKMDTADIVFEVKLMNGKEELASNLFYFASPKNLKLLKPEITKTIMQTEKGYSIVLSTDKLAKNVYLSVDGNGSFSDNFFDLLAGNKITINFVTKEKIEKFEEKLNIVSLVDSY